MPGLRPQGKLKGRMTHKDGQRKTKNEPEEQGERQNKLFYQLVSACRTSKGKDAKSRFKRHTCRNPNTITSIIVKLLKELNDLDYNKSVDLDRLEDFPRDDDRTTFVRESQRKVKLAGLQENEGESDSRNRPQGNIRPRKKSRRNNFVKERDCRHAKELRKKQKSTRCRKLEKGERRRLCRCLQT